MELRPACEAAAAAADGRPEPAPDGDEPASRAGSDAPAPDADDGGAGGVDSASAPVPAHPALRHAVAFLAVATLLQVLATRRGEAGPFDACAGFLVPRLLALGLRAGGGDDGGTAAGLACPPDRWVDEAFAARDRPGAAGLYSPAHDPRNLVSKPSLFPHCALRRWVQMEAEHACPEGEEYATVIYPHTIYKRAGPGRIPRIVHLSSPTNCLPSATVEALRGVVRQHGSQAYAIYVHSGAAMDNFLFQREWTLFPQVKEAALCGAGKLRAVAHAAMEELNVGNSTRRRDDIARRIALGLRRDLWRYMVLWEYGGIALDVEALHAVLWEEGSPTPSTNGANATVTEGGRDALRKLMRQWSAEKRDALLYFINNPDKQRLPFNDRIPLTDIMGAAPHHPLVYYGAKIAFKIAVWDSEKSITDMGRTTKIPPIREALNQFDRGWKNTKTGEAMEINTENKNSIHFVDGDAVLPLALTSPRTTPWRSVLAAFWTGGAGETPSEERIKEVMRSVAGRQKYIPSGMFSCMEYTLDMYVQTTTVK